MRGPSPKPQKNETPSAPEKKAAPWAAYDPVGKVSIGVSLDEGQLRALVNTLDEASAAGSMVRAGVQNHRVVVDPADVRIRMDDGNSGVVTVYQAILEVPNTEPRIVGMKTLEAKIQEVLLAAYDAQGGGFFDLETQGVAVLSADIELASRQREALASEAAPVVDLGMADPTPSAAMAVQALREDAIRDAKEAGSKGMGFPASPIEWRADEMFRSWMGRDDVAPSFAMDNQIGLTKEGALEIKAAYIAAYNAAYVERNGSNPGVEPFMSVDRLRMVYGQKVDGLELPADWSVHYKGYGGAGKWETKTYTLSCASDGSGSSDAPSSYEIRIPEDAALFPPKEVSREYRCLSALTLQEAVSGVFHDRVEKAAAAEAARRAKEAAALAAKAKTAIKTSALTGAALDWAVASCEEESVVIRNGGVFDPPGQFSDEGPYSPSTNAELAWPIIEREHISLVALDSRFDTDGWAAAKGTNQATSSTEHESHEPMYQFECEGLHYGPTSLVAAMRCYVASKLGDEVEVPEELRR